MVLDAPEIAGEAKPGQFVHVRCGDEYRPLLRRPFSIHKVEVQGIEILYKVVGEGTRILSERKKGEKLDILGPLGNGYRLPVTSHRSPVILVGGGVGVASLLFLAEKMILPITDHRLPITVLIGAKTRDQVLCEDDFRRLGCEVKISTEGGSYGHKGLVTELLKTFLQTPNSKLRTIIYACGPKPMLKEVADIANKNNILCQVSLEEHMACGLGACLGCAVKTVTSLSRAESRDNQLRVTSFIYRRVCKDGPVFNAREIFWG